MVETTLRVHTNDGVVKFRVKSNKELDDATVQNIQGLSFIIYWNDSTSEHYSLDTKLENGLWLENINFNNELNKATALILN